MVNPPIKLLILTALLTSVFSAEELNLKEQSQDTNIDPNSQDSSKETYRISSNDKRTIFGNLLNQNNYALARHFVYKNGVKYLMGYGQVDLRYMPHFKPVFIRPRPLAMPPWPSTSNRHPSVLHHVPKLSAPAVKPTVLSNHPIHYETWKPLATAPIIPIPTSKPTVWPLHISSSAPEEHSHQILQHPTHHHISQSFHMHPIKVSLPVLPFGAMILTPVLGNHQHLEYYPLPVQPIRAAEQPFHHHATLGGSSFDAHDMPVHHPSSYEVQDVQQAIVPGGSYEVHGYQPHQHVSYAPPSPIKPTYEIQPPAEATAEDIPHDPYSGSLETSYHEKHHYPDHSVIQPGNTDVQIPLHLAQHPNYRPEDYYGYMGDAGHYQGHIAGERSDEVVGSGQVRSKAPFKPSQRINSYKEV